MATILKIKPAYADRRVFHGRCNKPLGQQSQDELRSLAIMARRSNSRGLIDFFESLPSFEELLDNHLETVLQPILDPLDQLDAE